MIIQVNVTPEHIKNGKPRKPCSCPIALAVSEKVTGWVRVGPWDVRAGSHGYADLPEVAQQFMRKFDGGYRVDPFCFDLEVPAC